MPKAFLTAQWRNLLMANYAIDPEILKPYLPCRTEPDSFNGVHYISLVGFLFCNTRVFGISILFHRTFEEVNLRFYVRYRENGAWKRGVVFLKEIVPRHAITLVANTVYGENYTTHRMKHSWRMGSEGLAVSYEWKVGNRWNYLKALAEKEATSLMEGSEEAFITEHYWGYTLIDQTCAGTYQVLHPKWRVHKVNEWETNIDAATLYGTQIAAALSAAPVSVFLTEGSPVTILKGTKIFAAVSS